MGRVRRQVAQIVRVTGEDDAVWPGIRRGRDDGVHRGDASRTPGRGSQPRRVPCLRLLDGANLAGPQEPVDWEIPAMIPGQCFGEDHARYLRGPQAATL